MKKKIIIICVFAFLLCLVSAMLFITSQEKYYKVAAENTSEEVTYFENIESTKTKFATLERENNGANVDENENIEQSPNIDVVEGENSITDYIKNELTPLLTGLITAVVSILALLVPYIKTLGKLKKTQGAYANMYEENERLYKITEKVNFDAEREKITKEVIEEVSNKFKAYDNALASLIKEAEITSAQIATLIEGAKIAWKDAVGASVALCKVPSSTLLTKQALTIDFLKTYVADKLGIMREELDKKIDEDLSYDKLS